MNRTLMTFNQAGICLLWAMLLALTSARAGGLPPTISNPASVNTAVNLDVLYQITADNSPTSYDAAGLPQGLSINKSTGLITGRPKVAGTVGSTIYAYNAFGMGSKNITVFVAKGTPILSWQRPADIINPAALSGKELNAKSDVSGSFVYEPGPGTVLNPGADIPLRAIFTPGDGNNYFPATIQTAINVFPQAPKIVSPNFAVGNAGGDFFYRIIAKNGALAYDSDPLPEGLALDTAKGLISGKPTDPGSYSVEIRAINPGGIDKKSLNIVIFGKAPQIPEKEDVEGNELQYTGVVGQPFSFVIKATGEAPLEYTAEPLPQGLFLSGGVITGTPLVEGETETLLTVKNAYGTSSLALEINIKSSGQPNINSAMHVFGRVGDPFSYKITSGGSGVATFTTSQLPPGVSLNTDTINGTPTLDGDFQVDITATNNQGSDKKSVVLSFVPAAAPVITSADKTQTRAGQPFSFTIAADGVSTIDVAPLPPWLTINGTLLTTAPGKTVPPDAVGTLRLMIMATNDFGTAGQEFTIVINPDNQNPPSVVKIKISRNPVRTNVPVSFTATADSPSGLPLQYSWYFMHEKKPDGPPLGGLTVTRSFAEEGDYTVTCVAFNGFTKSVDRQMFSVSLSPNSGSTKKNLATGRTITNPVNLLAVRLPDSLGGVVDVDATEGTPSGSSDPDDKAAAPRGTTTLTDESTTTSITGRSSTTGYTGLNGAVKFTGSGVYVIKVTDSSGTTQTRTVSVTTPVSAAEAGQTGAVADTRTVTTPTNVTVTGKFNFGKKIDQVVLTGTVEIPAGTNLTSPVNLDIAIGNVLTTCQVDSKNKVTQLNGPVKKLRVTMPRTGTDHITKAGDKAVINLTLSAVQLDQAGFNSDGISNDGLTTKTILTRQLQMGVVLAGTASYNVFNVTFTYNKGVGSMSGRSSGIK